LGGIGVASGWFEIARGGLGDISGDGIGVVLGWYWDGIGVVLGWYWGGIGVVLGWHRDGLGMVKKMGNNVQF
jgi:hypothetical protein